MLCKPINMQNIWRYVFCIASFSEYAQKGKFFLLNFGKISIKIYLFNKSVIVGSSETKISFGVQERAIQILSNVSKDILVVSPL